MLPVLGRSLYDPIPCAVTRTRGRRNISAMHMLKLEFVEGLVNLLCDPDSVKQNCKLSGYRHHSPPSRMAATSRPEA